MVQFECPGLIHHLVSFNFGVHCGVPLPLHAGKGKCCMWLVIKWKFIDTKWVSWTPNGTIWMPQGHTPLGVIRFWVHCSVSLSSACRKREVLHVVVNKVEIYLAKKVLLTANGQIWMPQGHTPLGVITFWVHCGVLFFSACSKKEMLHVKG